MHLASLYHFIDKDTEAQMSTILLLAIGGVKSLLTLGYAEIWCH
jgi:hypothetical protein